MKLITRALSALVFTATVVTPLVSFAAIPSEAKESQSIIEQQFNRFPSEADWNND